MAYKGALMVSDEELAAGMQRCVCTHYTVIFTKRVDCLCTTRTSLSQYLPMIKHAHAITCMMYVVAVNHRCKEIGAIPMVHAENGDLVALGQQRVFDAGITGPEGHALSRPPELEAEATNRAIMMAKFINVPLYVVHVMSKMAMEEVATARKRGVRVVGEPLCTGLAKDQSELWNPDYDHAAAHVMSPPVRKNTNLNFGQRTKDSIVSSTLITVFALRE